MHLLARMGVVHNRSHRNLEHDISALASRLIRSLAMSPAFRLVLGIESKVHERIVTLARLHDYVAAPAAVATRRPSARNIFLAPERDTTVAAIPGLDSNCGLINEHLCLISHRVLSETKGPLLSRSRLISSRS